MSALEPAVDQFLPDVGQLMRPRAEEIDPLPAGELRVKAVLLRDWPRAISFSGVISPPGTAG